MFTILSPNFLRSISVMGGFDKDPRRGYRRDTHGLHESHEKAIICVGQYAFPIKEVYVMPLPKKVEKFFHVRDNGMNSKDYITDSKKKSSYYPPNLKGLRNDYKYLVYVTDPSELEIRSIDEKMTRINDRRELIGYASHSMTLKMVYNHKEDKWEHDKFSKVVDYVNRK